MVIDDYQLIPESRKAVEDYRHMHSIEEPIETIDVIGARWRRRSKAGPARPPAQPRRRPARQAEARAGQRGDPGQLPSLRELQLEKELRELRARLDAGEPARGGVARALRRVLGRNGSK